MLFLSLLHQSAHAQRIIKIEGKYALMNYRDEVVSGTFDTIYEHNDFYYFRTNNRFGAAHERQLEAIDWKNFSPLFDEIIYLNVSNEMRFVVRLNGKYGVCDANMKLQSPVAYDTIYTPRNWIGNICFEKNGKTAFHPFRDVLIADSLKFDFDQIHSSSYWLTTYRKGTKYGFFTRWNMESHSLPPVFDSVPKMGDAFIETWRDGVKTYYYSYDLLSHKSWTEPFSLEVGKGIKFLNFVGEGAFEIAGPQRTEQCMLEYYNFLIGTRPEDDLMCIDMSYQTVMEQFQNPTAQETLVPFWYERGYRDRDSVLMVKIRTPIDNGMVRETYISLRNLEELASVELKASETTVLKQCEWNFDYIALCIQEENGKVKRPYGFFEIDRTENFRRTKPMVDSYHKRGGGGSSSKKWMDILWMGGG